MNFSFPDKFYPWLPFLTLLRRELLRIWRVAIQTLITPIITAALYLFVFGATLGDRIPHRGNSLHWPGPVRPKSTYRR